MTSTKKIEWDSRCIKCLLRIKEKNGTFVITQQDNSFLYDLGQKFTKKHQKCGNSGTKTGKHEFINNISKSKLILSFICQKIFIYIFQDAFSNFNMFFNFFILKKLTFFIFILCS